MITRRDFFKITAASGALAAFADIKGAKATINKVMPNSDYCLEQKKEIPIIADVDLIVIGGSSRAVAAATLASKNGCSVFLIASLPYLGDDICGSFLCDVQEGETLHTALSRKVFFGKKDFCPLSDKTILEKELIDNDVKFLYSSYVSDVLIESSSLLRGVVIVNRSGRQAIRSKMIIDATQDSIVSLILDLPREQKGKGFIDYYYTVVGNKVKEEPDFFSFETLKESALSKGEKYPIIRYKYRSNQSSHTYESLMEIEQLLRSKTWDPDQVDSSDLLWYIPDENVICENYYQDNPSSVRQYPLDAFRPKGISNLWILGPCAGISRDCAEKIMRPIQAMWLGELLGEQIALRTNKIQVSNKCQVYSKKIEALNLGSIGENLSPLRPIVQKEFVASDISALPILGEYDVVILGGGTAGASAGISAAKQGVKTIVLEYLHGLGGLGTLGLIGCYWDGFREGFTSIIDEGVHNMAPSDHPRQEKDWRHRSVSDWKMEWYRKELLNAGGKLWFGVLGSGALVENNTVKGVVITTPFGRGIILSKVLIDSTGSADIAIAAGAQYEYTGAKTLAIQGAGAGMRNLGDSYNNNDWLFIDDTDILDVSRTFVQAKIKMAGNYDIVKIPQTRERRRVIGEYIVSVYDVLNHRRYADTISFHQSSFDTHGMIVDPYFILSPPMKRHVIYNADVPLRSLLPKGIEGILTTGLGASASRDAMPVIRMQPCLQNQGYAVGYLSAQCVKKGKTLRTIDIKAIQKHLVKIGNLPERVLTDKNFKAFSNAEMRKAADNVTDNYKGLEILLTDPTRSIKFIKQKLSQTKIDKEKVILGSILCILGDNSAAEFLANAIQQQGHWDQGWHYTGMHQFGMSLSPLDALIMALGKSKAAQYLPVVLKMAEQLSPEDYFSHFRAISMATESMKSKDSVPVLYQMLTTPGVRGHSIKSYREACTDVVPGDIDVSTRNLALKELHLARALYLCGDKDGTGQKVLEQYAKGLQGHYARYAYEVLQLNIQK